MLSTQGHEPAPIPTWHPKLSPYRLTVLATTICLGTVKAVTIQTGNTSIPITLEWVSGTVVFLILFLVGAYDSSASESTPRYLAWMFESDCLDLIWRFLSVTFTIHRPNYRTDERVVALNLNAKPPITTYRMFVCSSMAAFGLSKATFAYLGYSTAATWTDWALGTVATSIFYILGLYETNSTNLWPSFFAHDQRPFLNIVVTAASYTAATGISVAWVLYLADFLKSIWHLTPALNAAIAHPLSIDAVFFLLLHYFLLELFTVCMAISLMGLFWILLSVLSSSWVFRAIRMRILSTILPLFLGGDRQFTRTAIPTRYLDRAKTMFRVCTHIILHLFALATALTITLLITIVALFPNRKADLDSSAVPTVVSGSTLVVVVVMLWLDFVIVRSMVRPFYRYRYDSKQFRSGLLAP
ncbi:hypothetical protein GALMADRAFT_253312 [Galerina marginata CBS 339.88]|uniref:Uncharacterized protein n=1 Tax=Galerina marginata (strain CBS 339.88) TaxID=685588 RepID=A0A067SWG6_GALM3|nr:hypothetical protein GALMADRAFT_253312 [Galerina marginata CBS 339.88]